MKKRICANPECRIIFEPTAAHQLYHNRKCFRKINRQKQKESAFPFFTCPICKEITTLNFHPKVSSVKWYYFTCKNCGYRVCDDENAQDEETRWNEIIYGEE